MYKNVFHDWIEERRILESHLQKKLGTICDLSLKSQFAVANFNQKTQICRNLKILNKNFRSTKVSLS